MRLRARLQFLLVAETTARPVLSCEMCARKGVGNGDERQCGETKAPLAEAFAPGAVVVNQG